MPKTSSNESEPTLESPFQKVAECLYRHTSSLVYYALVKRAGKQYRRSLRTIDRKLAERQLAEFRQKVGRLEQKKSLGKVTFEEAAKAWFQSIKGNLKLRSAERRETSIRQLSATFGKLPVRNITTKNCDEWSARRGAGISASTYNNEMETLRAILEYAVREGIILDNPARVLKRRKLGKPQILIPSKAQFRPLVEDMRHQDSRSGPAADLVELLAYSGMRLAEATSIRWRDVYFERQQFVVTGGEAGTKNHEVRTVPLFPALQQFLERLKAQVPAEPGNKIAKIESAKRSMASACQRLGLPHFTHHSLRHYFVSNAIEAGVDFKVIAGWVGHKDGGLLVAKTYGHLRDTHSFEMAKRMTFSAHGAQTD
ncbi:MAG: tyrosine-type recombinase/integrase [Opitutaceae bacterium]